MRLLKYPKNLIIGKNNYIQKNVKIYENVIIGNNNKIYNGTVIYPNTCIGNNNVILNNNILGEHPVDSNDIYKNKIFNGLEIGDNNFFHVDNLIFNGYYKKTIIGNNNKLLSENHIGHDTYISNNVVLYPRCITGGLSKLMPFSTMGLNACIQQNTVLGHYSMVGMGNFASHNVFPFFIYFNQKYLRINKKKIPDELNVDKYIDDLHNIINDLKTSNTKFDKNILDKYNLSMDIKKYIIDFINEVKIYKL